MAACNCFYTYHGNSDYNGWSSREADKEEEHEAVSEAPVHARHLTCAVLPLFNFPPFWEPFSRFLDHISGSQPGDLNLHKLSCIHRTRCSLDEATPAFCRRGCARNRRRLARFTGSGESEKRLSQSLSFPHEFLFLNETGGATSLQHFISTGRQHVYKYKR